MSYFGNNCSKDTVNSCCNGRNLSKFNGNMDDIVSVPVYVQSIYDAVQSNLQGMKTVQNQLFSPAIPCGYTVSRVCDIRAKAYFDPCNTDDSRNLTVDVDTALSGAAFLKDCHGNNIYVTGPDGTASQKILYADSSCDDDCGTQVFGTQNVKISGNVQVFIDLILCNNCNHETKFTVCADIPIAPASNPMVLTNFFEICIPSVTDNAFLPRLTELTAVTCEARLATNNCGRDLDITPDGQLRGSLIIALCVTAEKKITAPIQINLLSTGLVDVPTQNSSICSGFPTMFAGSFSMSDNDHDCCDSCEEPSPAIGVSSDCGTGISNDCGAGISNDCGCSTHKYR